MSLPDFHAEPFIAAAVTLAIVVLTVVGLMRTAGLRRPSADLLSDESRDDDLTDWPGAVAAVQEPRWPGEDGGVPPALRVDCDCERPCEHTTAAARRYVGITGVEREAYERSLRPVVDEPTDTETARILESVRRADTRLRGLPEGSES